MKLIKLKLKPIFVLALALFYSNICAAEVSRFFAGYWGVATPTPLIEIVRLRSLDLKPYYLFNLEYSERQGSGKEKLNTEWSVSVHHHFETLNDLGGSLAYGFRWNKTPWSHLLGGSILLSNGLTYSLRITEFEKNLLENHSNWLYMLLFEYAFGVSPQTEVLVRLHHRSGVFGLINNVVGGSDYLSFGVRFRL